MKGLRVINAYKRMSRRKKLNILLPVVILMFIGAYAKHHFIDRKSLPESHLQDKVMDETSGVAASSINPDIYYIHNDSGDTSRFFAITPDGKLHTTIYYQGHKQHLGALDCEDISVGPGPVKGKSYVYIGDIGDNGASRKFITIYRAEEKRSWLKDTVAHVVPSPINLQYPDAPKDAEAMMVDPIEKLFYIVTKRYDSVSVYTSPLAYKNDDTVKMTFRTRLFFKGIKPFKWITAGDISKDGQKILLKSYEKVYYWTRRPNEAVWQAMRRPPLELPYKQEKQGEAIGFTPDGKGYYTISEGVFSPIYYYNVPN
ncbi:hypothetical protein DYU05_14515 [Mucilaginibacter terrenus]|uniref:Uncharacterized protein n=1 Tax=Mucilaginibacter terrenus TaxID=2482727 RepID=A0A3E2NQS8_9SPHI|nr:hypothetical protein [Mucilaginibacter terrenus]RFZ83345.1 hypothetical protein DYU05_14515 [Mucilaginibacter terrenus]